MQSLKLMKHRLAGLAMAGSLILAGCGAGAEREMSAKQPATLPTSTARGADRPASKPSPAAAPRYFQTPREAVAETARLMQEQKWAELADYYDLAGTNIDRGELVSGRFFVRTDPPQAAHPGGFWKYRQPFPPGFAYDHAEPSSNDPATVNVTVAINIDQGGGAVQRGVQTFQLRKSDKGYQLLPRR